MTAAIDNPMDSSPAETFTASRWTQGNFFFPTRLVISPQRVARVKSRLFGSNEEQIEFKYLDGKGGVRATGRAMVVPADTGIIPRRGMRGNALVPRARAIRSPLSGAIIRVYVRMMHKDTHHAA